MDLRRSRNTRCFVQLRTFYGHLRTYCVPQKEARKYIFRLMRSEPFCKMHAQTHEDCQERILNQLWCNFMFYARRSVSRAILGRTPEFLFSERCSLTVKFHFQSCRKQLTSTGLSVKAVCAVHKLQEALCPLPHIPDPEASALPRFPAIPVL